MSENSFDLYKDENSPKWPNNGTPFNRWYNKIHAFLYALQNDFYWSKHPLFGKVKYLNIRVDTRNGSFLVFREADKHGGEPVNICPDDLGVEYKEVGIYPPLRSMDTAPCDRPILLKVNGEKWITVNHGYVVVKYHEELLANFACWVIDDERSLSINDKDILGWYDLPK